MHLIRRKIFLTSEQFYCMKRRGSDPLIICVVCNNGRFMMGLILTVTAEWASSLSKTGRPFVSLSLCGALGWKLFIWSILFSPLLWPDLCGLLGDKSALPLCCSILMESRGRRERDTGLTSLPVWAWRSAKWGDKSHRGGSKGGIKMKDVMWLKLCRRGKQNNKKADSIFW